MSATTTVRDLVEPILMDMGQDGMFLRERQQLQAVNEAMRTLANDTFCHHEEYVRQTVVGQQEYPIPGALKLLSLIAGIEWDEDPTSETYGQCTNAGQQIVTIFGGTRVKPLWAERYPPRPSLSAMGR